jgi:hypothetical protein
MVPCDSFEYKTPGEGTGKMKEWRGWRENRKEVI